MAISFRVRSTILAESLGVCSFCLKEIGPDGDIAHIVAEKPEGPRGNDPLPLSQRNNADNLLYLCVSCHREKIDKYPELYPVQMLRDIKDKFKTIRSVFHVGQLNYMNFLFHDVTPNQLTSILNNACCGIQIQLSFHDQNILSLMKENIRNTVAPSIMINDIDQINYAIMLLIDTFDREGEEIQCTPFEYTTRVMFYKEGDPDTFKRRDEFWLLYEKIEIACLSAVNSIKNIRCKSNLF